MTEPISVKRMGRKRNDRHLLTFCSMMRDIYWGTENEEIKMKCRLATTEAKIIVRELRRYKAIFEKEEITGN